METRKISIHPSLDIPVFVFNGIIDDQAEAKKMAKSSIKMQS